MICFMIHEVLSFMSMGDWYDICEVLPSHERQMLFEKISWIEDNIPPVIVNLFGIKRLLVAPFLPWQDSFEGFTDYIDRIEPHHVSCPIMIGKDAYHRSYITLRTKSGTLEFVDTLFQRFSDDSSTWAHGYHSKHRSWMRCFRYFCQANHIVDEGFVMMLQTLLREGYTDLEASSGGYNRYFLF